MTSQEFYREKALRVKELYNKGLPFVKVYAPVRDGNKFIVLEKHRNGKTTYDISGGGVEEGETLEEAIKRELMEELNIEVDVIKELGVYDKFYHPWELDGEIYNIQYEIHVFDTKIKNEQNTDMHVVGLQGEFDNDTVKIARIDKKTLLSEVTEFKDFGINID